MSLNRMLQWLLLAATAALLMFLKWLHLGVTHYNVFLLILVGWVLGLVLALRVLTPHRRSGNCGGEASAERTGQDSQCLVPGATVLASP